MKTNTIVALVGVGLLFASSALAAAKPQQQKQKGKPPVTLAV